MSTETPTYEPGETEDRPWGDWQVLDVQPRVVVKKINVVPGGRISLQSHAHRMERWVVTEGEAVICCDGVINKLGVGESVLIPRGSLHRLSNEGEAPLSLIEIQMGDYLSEEDIERYKDDYGRVD